MTGQPSIQVALDGPTLRVRLNRPAKLNALDTAALLELRQAVDRADADPSVRVVVLSAAGRAFCAGVDLGLTSDRLRDRAAIAAIADQMHGLVAAIEDSPVPWIAAVNGLACAGGLEITLGCDIVIASSAARFADVHVRHGLFPGGGASQRLPRLVGSRRARWLLLSGEWIEADVARDWGLVTEIVPPEHLDDRADEVASLLARRSPRLADAIKTTLRRGEGRDVRTALRDERELFLDYMGSADARIGLDAFAARSAPDFGPREPRG